MKTWVYTGDYEKWLACPIPPPGEAKERKSLAVYNHTGKCLLGRITTTSYHGVMYTMIGIVINPLYLHRGYGARASRQLVQTYPAFFWRSHVHVDHKAAARCSVYAGLRPYRRNGNWLVFQGEGILGKAV